VWRSQAGPMIPPERLSLMWSTPQGGVSVGELEDIGWFLAEIPFPSETPRHRHDIGCRGKDHVDLVIAPTMPLAFFAMRDR